MYGSNMLPNTGAAAGVGAGVAFNSMWVLLAVVTVLTLALALGRLVPRRQH